MARLVFSIVVVAFLAIWALSSSHNTADASFEASIYSVQVVETPAATSTPSLSSAGLVRVSGGLGVTLDSLQRALEGQGLAFRTGESTAQGIPVMFGTAKGISIVLSGQPEKLVQVGITLDYGPAVDKQVLGRQVDLVFKVLTWLSDGDTSASAWFALNMNSVTPSPIFRTFSKVQVGMSTNEKRDGLIVVIHPSESGQVTASPVPSTAAPVTIATPDPKEVILADKQSYNRVDPRELEKSPDRFKGQKIALSGEVFRINEERSGTSMQIWIERPGGSAFDRIAVYVTYPGTLPGLYKNDTVLVYGVGGGSVTGMNALGGIIGQPLIEAKYVDYGSAIPLPPAIAKNIATTLNGEWQITYVGEFRDKTIFYAVGAKTAMGIWATVQFRIRNLMPGTARLSTNYDFVIIDEGGKTYEDDLMATLHARWQYCGCDDMYRELAPGEEAVIVATFDVPEGARNLTVALKKGILGKPMDSPRFQVTSFDQVPAWRPKK